MKLPPQVAGFDSASAMVVALARFLHGKDTPPLGKPAFRALRPVAAAASRLPARWQESLYSLFSGAEGGAREEVAGLDLDAVAAGITGAYPRRRYPAVLIGSSGGALVHLAAALGVPWLPQTLLLPVRQRGLDPDDPQRAREALAGTGRALLDRNPDVVLHDMHDPNADGDAPEAEWGFEPALDQDIAGFAERRALRRHLGETEPYDQIDLALFCHGVESAGLATASQWREIGGDFSGVDPRRYPHDFRTFFAFRDALRRTDARHVPEPLSVAAFEDYRGSRRYGR